MSIGAFLACALPHEAAASDAPEPPTDAPVDVVVLPPSSPPPPVKPAAPSTAAPTPAPSPGPAVAPGTSNCTSAEERATAPPAQADHWQWYGWQILLSDVAALGTFALAASAASNSTGDNGPSDVILGLGISEYVMGGFAVHALHRRWLSAGLSIGLRVALPFLGAVIGAALASNQDQPWSGLAGAAAGFLGGAGLAHVVDVSALSLAPPAKHPAGASALNTHAPTVQWYPVLRIAPENRPGSATILGVGATF